MFQQSGSEYPGTKKEKSMMPDMTVITISSKEKNEITWIGDKKVNLKM